MTRYQVNILLIPHWENEPLFPAGMWKQSPVLNSQFATILPYLMLLCVNEQALMEIIKAAGTKWDQNAKLTE